MKLLEAFPAERKSGNQPERLLMGNFCGKTGGRRLNGCSDKHRQNEVWG